MELFFGLGMGLRAAMLILGAMLDVSQTQEVLLGGDVIWCRSDAAISAQVDSIESNYHNWSIVDDCDLMVIPTTIEVRQDQITVTETHGAMYITITDTVNVNNTQLTHRYLVVVPIVGLPI